MRIGNDGNGNGKYWFEIDVINKSLEKNTLNNLHYIGKVETLDYSVD